MTLIKKSKDLVVSFLESWLYPVFIAFFVLLGHSLSIELFSSSIIAISIIIGLFFCKDIRFLVSPALMFIFIVSSNSFACWEGEFINKAFYTGITIMAILVAIALIARFIIFRKSISLIPVVKSPLFYGLLAFSLSILLGGLFNSNMYSLGLFKDNLIFSVAITFSFIGIFILFYSGINFSNDFKKYLVFVLFVSSILVCLEFYTMLLCGKIELVKESIVTGWGIWNNIGAILTVLLPVHFYCFAYCKKFKYLFLITALVSYVTIVLTFSRASLLVATLILALCMIFSCFVGQNKLLFRILIAVLGTLSIIAVIIMWDKLLGLAERFFDDNGRFEIYKKGLEKFLNHPILGAGFMDSHGISSVPDHRYHNTLVQILASCGTVGILAYAFHRFNTISLIIKKKSGRNIFLAFCLLGLILTSLFDIHFFNIYPAFYYVLILIAIEKSN